MITLKITSIDTHLLGREVDTEPKQQDVGQTFTVLSHYIQVVNADMECFDSRSEPLRVANYIKRVNQGEEDIAIIPVYVVLTEDARTLHVTGDEAKLYA